MLALLLPTRFHVHQEYFRKLVAQDRVFDNRDQHFGSRAERYQRALSRVKQLHLYKTKLGLSPAGAFPFSSKCLWQSTWDRTQGFVCQI